MLVRVANVHRLHGCHDLVFLDPAIRLYNRQAQCRRPNDRGHLLASLTRGGGRVLLGLRRAFGVRHVASLFHFHLGILHTLGRNALGNEARRHREPVLDHIRARKQVADAFHDGFGQVRCRNPQVFHGRIPTIGQLPHHLVLGTNIRNTIHCRHDGLLDDFACDFAAQLLRNFIAGHSIALQFRNHQLSHTSVHIRGAVTATEVDLLGTLQVAAQSSVVLETIACAILVHRHLRRERLGSIWVFPCLVELKARS